MSNWKKTVAKANQKAYAIPDGWSTEDQVAEELGCPVPRVKDLLKPGIAANEIERHIFPVWIDELQSTKRITCYRPTPSSFDGRPPKKTPEERTQDALLKDSTRTDEKIANNLKGVGIALVRQVRAQLTEEGKI